LERLSSEIAASILPLLTRFLKCAPAEASKLFLGVPVYLFTEDGGWIGKQPLVPFSIAKKGIHLKKFSVM
jgi:hypothetical protein